MISPSFCQRDRLGFLHLLGAFVQRLFAARGQQRRSLAGKARALRRELQAGGEARECPVRSDRPWRRRDARSTRPAPALMTIAMPAITAKAANRLPLTPNCGKLKSRRAGICRCRIVTPFARCPVPTLQDESSRGSIAVPG